MRIQEADNILREILTEWVDARESENIRNAFWEDLFHIRGGVDRVLHTRELEVFYGAVEKLKKGLPIQYVTALAYFYGLKFYVNEKVLIPRPETEELVFLFLEQEGRKDALKVLDIGTGSGCIPITIKHKCPGFKVDAIDVSPGALEVAKKNAERNETKIRFYQLDFLNEEHWQNMEEYDVIISNPPYVALTEKDRMTASVLKFEPAIALFPPGKDELIFYRKIADFGKTHLKTDGRVYLECNEFNIDKVSEIFEDSGYKNIIAHTDMQGKDRFVTAIKNGS